MKYIFSVFIIVYKFVIFYTLYSWAATYIDFIPELNAFQSGLIYTLLGYGTVQYDIYRIKEKVDKERERGGKDLEEWIFHALMNFLIPSLYLLLGYILTFFA